MKFIFKSSELHHMLILEIWISLPSSGLLLIMLRFSWNVGTWVHDVTFRLFIFYVSLPGYFCLLQVHSLHQSVDVHTHLCVHACVLVSEKVCVVLLQLLLYLVSVIAPFSVVELIWWMVCFAFVESMFTTFPKLVKCELISQPYCRINVTVL